MHSERRRNMVGAEGEDILNISSDEKDRILCVAQGLMAMGCL